MADGTAAHDHALRRRALARAEPASRSRPMRLTVAARGRGRRPRRLLAIAARLRDLGWGDTVTYSRKVFVPLTMLCRDHCHYCTFAKPPAKLDAPFLTPDEVVAIAEAGARAGCKEALFTLGDRPEERYPRRRAWLAARGYGSTLDYVRAVAIRVIEETGLLPHLNPGVMSYEELARLKHVSASMGLMLETSSARLSANGAVRTSARRTRCRPSGCGRSRTRGASRSRSRPASSSGIGETARERAESSARDPRPAPALSPHPGGDRPELPREAGHRDASARPSRTTASSSRRSRVARLVLGPHVSVQAPPNLSDEARAATRLLDAGINDWGGVSPLTPDHVNPERPWPQIEALAATTAARGKTLRERLAIYPRYAAAARSVDRGQDARAGRRRSLGRRRARASRAAPRADRRGRTPTSPGSRGRSRSRSPRRPARVCAPTPSPSTARSSGGQPRHRGVGRRAPRARRGSMPRSARRCARPRRTGRSPTTRRWRCSGPREPPLDALCRVADDLRAEAVGPEVTYVINRNINFTNVCYVGCRFCAFAQREVDAESYTLTLEEVADRAEEAWARRRDRGVHARRDPSGPPRHLLLRPDPCREGARAGHARPRVQPHGDHERGRQTRRLASPNSSPNSAMRGSTRCPEPRRRSSTTTFGGSSPRENCRPIRGNPIVRTAHGSGHPELLDDHVRPRRCPAALGLAHAPIGADPGRHGRVHGVRAVAVRPSQRADLPRRRGAPRSVVRGQSADACGRSRRCSTELSTTSKCRG